MNPINRAKPPVERSLGQQILSGSINQDAVVTAKALHGAADSQYQQIVALVNRRCQQSALCAHGGRLQYSVYHCGLCHCRAAWFVSGDAHRFLEVLVVATPRPLLFSSAHCAGVWHGPRQ